MAAPNIESLARQIGSDILFVMPIGLIMPIAMMVHHEPGSNVFCLIWEPGKIYASMIGASIFITILVIGRRQKWRDLRKG